MSGRNASWRPQLTQLWFSKKIRWSQWSQWKIRIAADHCDSSWASAGMSRIATASPRRDRHFHCTVLPRLEGVEGGRELGQRKPVREQRREIDAAADEQRQRGVGRVGVRAIADDLDL